MIDQRICEGVSIFVSEDLGVPVVHKTGYLKLHKKGKHHLISDWFVIFVGLLLTGDIPAVHS